MSTYEERAAHALEVAGSSVPVVLRGIGWALLHLAEAGRDPAFAAGHGAQTCHFCGDSYGDMGHHFTVNLKGCGDKIAKAIITHPAGGTS